jgi:hypothetical protein
MFRLTWLDAHNPAQMRDTSKTTDFNCFMILVFLFFAYSVQVFQQPPVVQHGHFPGYFRAVCPPAV